MADAHFVSDLALAWAAAFVGGVVAQRLKQPPILGYLLAGVAQPVQQVQAVLPAAPRAGDELAPYAVSC